MTEQDVNSLSITNLYQFFMYYGETKIGTIINEGGKCYFIERGNVISNPGETTILKRHSEEIDLETVSDFRYSNDDNRNYSGFKVFNAQKPNKINASKMVILGAGASAGISSDEKVSFPNCPPLTYQIFADEYEEILNNFPGAKQLSSLTLGIANLENFFQKKWETIKRHHHPDLLNKIINTQYYLQYLFEKEFHKYRQLRKNNYNILAELISDYCASNKKQMIVTSFNYDTLFEQSLENSIRYQYKSINDYIDLKRRVILFKPHGSWNWIKKMRRSVWPPQRKGDNLFLSKTLYEQQLNYHTIFKDLQDQVEVIDHLESYTNDSINDAFLPQLLIPFTNKDEFIMPHEHRELLSVNLADVDEIVVIGWKGTEQVFKGLLKIKLGKKLVKIDVVNLGDSSIKETLSDSLPNAEWSFHNSFSEFMVECQKRVLSSPPTVYRSQFGL